MTAGSLEERVQRLEDERNIVRTLYAYAAGLDYGPQEAFVDVFTEDGSWTRMPGRRKGTRAFIGKHGFSEMYRDHTHAPEYFHKHLILNPRVDVDGDTAKAVSNLVFICDHPDGPYIRAFSRCTDRLVRGEDGVWRIAERQAELESWADADFPPGPWSTLPDVVR
jgi:ketosteroid isomerase-like protein